MDGASKYTTDSRAVGEQKGDYASNLSLIITGAKDADFWGEKVPKYQGKLRVYIPGKKTVAYIRVA